MATGLLELLIEDNLLPKLRGGGSFCLGGSSIIGFIFYDSGEALSQLRSKVLAMFGFKCNFDVTFSILGLSNSFCAFYRKSFLSC